MAQGNNKLWVVMCCQDTIGDDTLTHPIPVFATYGDASRYCAEMHRKHSDIVICFRVVPWSRYWEAKNRIEWCTRLRHCAGNVHILTYLQCVMIALAARTVPTCMSSYLLMWSDSFDFHSLQTKTVCWHPHSVYDLQLSLFFSLSLSLEKVIQMMK